MSLMINGSYFAAKKNNTQMNKMTKDFKISEGVDRIPSITDEAKEKEYLRRLEEGELHLGGQCKD